MDPKTAGFETSHSPRAREICLTPNNEQLYFYRTFSVQIGIVNQKEPLRIFPSTRLIVAVDEDWGVLTREILERCDTRQELPRGVSMGLMVKIIDGQENVYFEVLRQDLIASLRWLKQRNGLDVLYALCPDM